MSVNEVDFGGKKLKNATLDSSLINTVAAAVPREVVLVSGHPGEQDPPLTPDQTKLYLSTAPNDEDLWMYDSAATPFGVGSYVRFIREDDSRLSNARPPTAHSHGNLTSDGKIGTTAGKAVVTGSDGLLAAADYVGGAVNLYDGIQETPVLQFFDLFPEWSSIATAEGTPGRFRDSIGAAAVAHTHSATSGEITGLAAVATSGSAANLTGTLDVARLPTRLERAVTGGNTGTAVTLSLTNGSVLTYTLSGNCTFTMPTVTAGASFTLFLTQAGSFTATFTGVRWSGGTAPTITTGANKVDILSFISNGTHWYGAAVQNYG